MTCTAGSADIDHSRRSAACKKRAALNGAQVVESKSDSVVYDGTSDVTHCLRRFKFHGTRLRDVFQAPESKDGAHVKQASPDRRREAVLAKGFGSFQESGIGLRFDPWAWRPRAMCTLTPTPTKRGVVCSRCGGSGLQRTGGRRCKNGKPGCRAGPSCCAQAC